MKTTITVSKKSTINTGNYSSVQPSVSLTIHDVPLKEIKQIHKDLDIIADVLFHEQIKSDAETMGDMKKLGLGEYFSKINNEQMIKDLEDSINSIIEISREGE